MKIKSSRPCLQCRTFHEVEFKGSNEELQRRIQKLQGGSLIQDVFPEFNTEEREILISGTCDKAWKEIFASEEEG